MRAPGSAAPACFPVRQRWLLLLFFISGAPALMAQLTWVRVFAAGLGHEIPALLGVVSAFFAGLAAGAWLLDGVIARSSRPAMWYGGLECFCAIWMAAGAFVIPFANDLALSWTGVDPNLWRQALVAFGIPLVVIGPSAAAMGGTLPAADRAIAPWMPRGRAIAALYGLNTAGAMAGIAVAVGLLMPALGFRATLWVAASLHALCGLGAMAWGRSSAFQDNPRSQHSPDAIGEGDKSSGAWLAFGTGLLGIAFELLGVRALAQVTENTVHTFAGALGIYLLGTAVGARLCQAMTARGRDLDLAKMLWSLGVACLLGMGMIGQGLSMIPALRAVFGSWGGEVAMASLVFLAPSILMGITFSRIVQDARRDRGGVGRAMAFNTLGAAAAGPLMIGVLLPALGLKWAFLSIAMGYGILAATRTRRWTMRYLAVPFVAVVAVVLPDLKLLELPPGSTLLRFEEGRLGTVAVIRTADGHRALRVNNHFQQGGTATAGAARRHAHLPLLLHPAPRRALFLGVGTGVTMGAASTHPGLAADGVELLPEVVDVLAEFEPENAAPQRRSGFRIHTADARRFVRCTTELYDVVVADLFHPAEDGAGFLYTREHFKAMRARLAPGGLACQWLPVHQLDVPTLAIVARTFMEVFPDATLWLLRFNMDAPVVALIGGTGPWRVDSAALDQRLVDPALRAATTQVAFNTSVRVLGCLMGGNASLRRWAGSGGIATDDQPAVLFRAPAATYHPRESPGDRLLTLLNALEPDFDLLVSRENEPAAAAMVKRLQEFRSARDAHLRGLMEEDGGRLEAAMEQYLASAAASPDYTGGYAQAVLVASAYARENAEFSRTILRRLITARPEQRLAAEVLERLESEPR